LRAQKKAMTTKYKNILQYLFSALYIFISLTACRKDAISGDPASNDPGVIPLVTSIGTSLGARVTKEIGNAGGTLESADGILKITIPAGALSATTTIGIEPVSNTNIAGIGNAFRLTPHGQQFSKPVTITCSWEANADTIGLLQTLGMAYQQQDGIWKFVGARHLDQAQKTISYATSHFSDWSLMNEISLVPYRADVDPGGHQNIYASLFVAKEPDDDLIVPLPGSTNTETEPGYPVGTPVDLPGKYIKKWSLAGPGKITPLSGASVKYEAPSSVSGFATAAVSLELNPPDTAKGQYLLVSNINIRSGSWIELSINGSEPFTFEASPAVHAGNKYILANPDNTGGGYFLLQWTDGIGIHPFTTGSEGTYFHWLSAGVNYVSMYRPDAHGDLLPSGGSVNVTKVSDGKAEGTFNVTEAGYGDNLTAVTTAQGRFKVKLAN
jgi:hypothetical protein